MKRPTWFPDWSNEIVAVVASGPSASSCGVHRLRGRARVVAVNTSWELVPWADVLFAADEYWWAMHAEDVERRFDGISVTLAGLHVHQVTSAYTVRAAEHAANRAWMLMDPPGVIGLGGNSGFGAINLTAQFGAKRIILVGFDMHINDGVHWHGAHDVPLRNPDNEVMGKWRRRLDAQANTLCEYGIDVVNASSVSALKNFRKTTIEEALDQWTQNDAKKFLRTSPLQSTR